jgi:hypothetical protein
MYKIMNYIVMCLTANCGYVHIKLLYEICSAGNLMTICVAINILIDSETLVSNAVHPVFSN